MRCKKHVIDPSSTVGVCATCLRDRLFVIIAAQAREDRRRSDNNASPLVFPRSVSPYISSRKSDNSTTETWHHRQQKQQEEGIHHPRFRNTPHVDPTGKLAVGSDEKKRGLGLSFFTKPFISKPDKLDPDVSGLDPGRVDSGSCTSSRSWFSAILFGRRRKINKTFSLDEPSIRAQRRVTGNADKGMSPARHSDEETEDWNYYSTGSLPECTKQRRETPKRTPVWAPTEKRGGHNRNGSGLGFCLSPLVRPSPSRHLSQKGMKPEMVVPGDMRVVPVRRSPANTTGFDKNRSKKMCDFGRCQHNR